MLSPLTFRMKHDDKLPNRTPLHQLTVIVLLDPLYDLQHSGSIDKFDQFLIHCEVQLEDV